MKNNHLMLLVASGVIFPSVLLSGCGPAASPSETGPATSKTGTSTVVDVAGEVSIDGSSTVYPILESAAEMYGEQNKKATITISSSGTGGGFKKFIAGEIDIANASRPVEKDELEKLKAAGVEFIELPIAFDGLSIVVNPANTAIKTLTIAELKKIWEPNSKVNTWADVRSGLPAEKIKLYGAGTDSGTFEYFTEAIVGKKKASRTDYTPSEDDNTLVQGIAGDKWSLGYFGYAYYESNKDKVTSVGIDAGKGAIFPSPETINDGTYSPLSRPLLIYVKKSSLDKPAVAAFLKYLFENPAEITKAGRYIPLPESAYAAIRARLESRTTGTVFTGETVGMKIEDILKLESKN